MRLFLSWLFALVIGCSGSYAAEPMPRSDAEHLVEIRFGGNRALADDEVRAALGGTRVRRDAFERGVLLLTAAYYDKGYLTVKVDVQGTPDAAVVRIVEGDRFRVSASEVVERGADGSRVEMLPAAAAIAPEVTRFAGEWFDRAAILDVLTRLRRAYQDEGFATVEIEPETALDPAHAQVRVLVPIKRGPLVHVREVRVVGLDGTPEAVVRREIGIAPNDVFSATKIERTRERLMALGRFRRVDTSTDSSGTVVTFEFEEGAPKR